MACRTRATAPLRRGLRRRAAVGRRCGTGAGGGGKRSAGGDASRAANRRSPRKLAVPNHRERAMQEPGGDPAENHEHGRRPLGRGHVQDFNDVRFLARGSSAARRDLPAFPGSGATGSGAARSVGRGDVHSGRPAGALRRRCEWNSTGSRPGRGRAGLERSMARCRAASRPMWRWVAAPPTWDAAALRFARRRRQGLRVEDRHRSDPGWPTARMAAGARDAGRHGRPPPRPPGKIPARPGRDPPPVRQSAGAGSETPGARSSSAPRAGRALDRDRYGGLGGDQPAIPTASGASERGGRSGGRDQLRATRGMAGSATAASWGIRTSGACAALGYDGGHDRFGAWHRSVFDRGSTAHACRRETGRRQARSRPQAQVMAGATEACR